MEYIIAMCERLLYDSVWGSAARKQVVLKWNVISKLQQTESTSGCHKRLFVKIERAITASIKRAVLCKHKQQQETGRSGISLCMILNVLPWSKKVRGPVKKAIQLHGRNDSSPEARLEKAREQERCALGLFLNNLCSTLTPLSTDSHKQRNPNSLTPFA